MSVVLSEHLPLLASAPDGIQKLRGLILELAVRGKLVPQNPDDEPASELLKRIAQEQARLTADGIYKKAKALPHLEGDEEPFTVPPSWCWVRLGQLVDIVYGKGLSTSDLTADGYEVFGANGVIGRYHSFLYEKSQLLLSCRGAYSGKPNISPPKCFITSNSLVLQNRWELLNQKFYYYALTCADKEKIVTGSAQPQVTTTNAEPFPVVLPPLAEQHRIVAKVDELMALCDRLEAEQADAASAHARLVETLLGTLTQSTNAADLAANWQRLAKHFDTLFTTEASIDALKQTVLQLAVMGKLVPQDANDEPASELLKRVAKERARLEAEGVCKKSKATPLEGGGDQAFAIPDTWLWASLSSISVTSTGKTPATSKAEYYGDNLPFIGPGQLTPAGEILPPEKLLSDVGRTETTLAKAGDILMVCIGGSIGKAAIANIEVAFNQQINCASPILISSKYLYSGMTAQYFQKAVLAKATGSATPIINRSNWDEIPLPIPPLAEQRRIVAKVDELMALCDSLKVDLGTARLHQATLADTLIESALEAA